MSFSFYFSLYFLKPASHGYGSLFVKACLHFGDHGVCNLLIAGTSYSRFLQAQLLQQPWPNMEESKRVQKWEIKLQKEVTHKCKICGSKVHSWRACFSYFKDWQEIVEDEGWNPVELLEVIKLAQIWWQ